MKVDEDFKDEQEQPSIEGPEPLTQDAETSAEPFIPYFTVDFCKKLFS